jgi:hypothetical protein
MASFRCEKVYYVPHQDLVAFAGAMESGFVRPGFRIDLPRELHGPGWVPLLDVQTVPFRDGRTRLCLLVEYQHVASNQLMEFSDLEGLSLEIKQ